MNALAMEDVGIIHVSIPSIFKHASPNTPQLSITTSAISISFCLLFARDVVALECATLVIATTFAPFSLAHCANSTGYALRPEFDAINTTSPS